MDSSCSLCVSGHFSCVDTMFLLVTYDYSLAARVVVRSQLLPKLWLVGQSIVHLVRTLCADVPCKSRFTIDHGIVEGLAEVHLP